MRTIVLAFAILAQLGWATLAHAQSLADVARQEEARRKTIKAPSKVYTNESLRPEPAPSAASTPATPSSAVTPPSAPASTSPATATATDDDATPAAGGAAPAVRDEKYWRGRLDAERAALTRAQTMVDALQSRVNALATDFVNRDDPAQRNVIAQNRQTALAELDRVKQEIAGHEKAIAAIQEEARRANVPPGWVR